MFYIYTYFKARDDSPHGALGMSWPVHGHSWHCDSAAMGTHGNAVLVAYHRHGGAVGVKTFRRQSLPFLGRSRALTKGHRLSWGC